MLRANLYLESQLIERAKPNDREKKKRKKITERRHVPRCARCLARLSLEASCISCPALISFPQVCITLLLMSLLTKSLSSNIPPYFGEWRTKQERKDCELRSCATCKFIAAVSKKKIVIEILLSSPRLEILVFNDRPMGWEDRCVMCRSFS